jgi:peptide/nickel transport system substrate-binding protein
VEIGPRAVEHAALAVLFKRDLDTVRAHPDQTFPQLYGCSLEFNRNNYYNPEVEELIGRQSSEADQEKRKQLVWQIERKLAEDDARPIIFYNRDGTCRQPHSKGLTLMVNSIFNGWRMEDVWLDK